MESYEEQFDKIVQDFLRQMAAVRCPLPDYIDALQDAQNEIDIALAAAGQDMEARG